MPSDSGERRPYPPPAQAEHLPCPRCDSTNTKFCYYNNYNLSQPRHFCKACRRYWTQGGTLRNIPVGGGTRKSSKRPRPSSSAMLDNSIAVEHRVNMIGSSASPISVSGQGSFTSLLGGYGVGGIGSSPGFDQMGAYGFGGRGIWGFSEVGNAADSGGCGGHGGGGLGSVWEANGGEIGTVDGECFAPPELAIFMPEQGLK